MIHLRPPQIPLEAAIYRAWQNGARNVLAVAPTGFGKTVLFSKILYDHKGACAAIAHRQELVSQMSIALARNGVRHGIVAPPSTCKMITALHMDIFGRSYYDPQSPKRVAGVDTLRNMSPNDTWLQQVTLTIGDEAHHNLAENKWGKALALFPNAYNLGVTATPCRADGRGLGRHADGIYDEMVVGPSMRSLIDQGYLTDYRIICAQPSDLDLANVRISANGDFNYDEVRAAVHQSSRIVGDVVSTYRQYARGKLGITFAVDVEEATKQAEAFRAAGIPAEIVTAKTPDRLRAHILREFKARRILQLVNVDLFGEGFDLPAIEVVSMARPTQSFPLYAQCFGRALRLMVSSEHNEHWGEYTDAQRLDLIADSGKPHGLILDHVGNTFRHGLPDAHARHLSWTLDRRERRSSGAPSDAEPLRICANPNPEALRVTTRKADGRSYAELVAAMGDAAALDAGYVIGPLIPCAQPFPRFKHTCPHCGYAPAPAERGTPEQVEGDLAELSPAALAAMRGAIDRADDEFVAVPRGASFIVSARLHNLAAERKEAQSALRNAMAQWGGCQGAMGLDTREQQRKFFITFGIDVGTAQTLAVREANELYERVTKDIDGLVNSGLYSV